MASALRELTKEGDGVKIKTQHNEALIGGLTQTMGVKTEG